MFTIILLLFKFYFAVALSLFIPGYFFVKTFFKKQKEQFSTIEYLLLAFGFSLIITNFLVIMLNFLSIPITSGSLLIVLTTFSIFFWFFAKEKKTNEKKIPSQKKVSNIFKDFSKKQLFLFLGILSLSCIIRTFYLADGIVPQTTDLGHHIYWSKTISQTGQLPNYGMPDFIIGEHIIFAVVQLLSGFSYISAMPISILFLINIFSLIAISVSAHSLTSQFTSKKIARNSALFTLLIIGTFYATSSPQAKFIAGGVVGNIIGNFFIPLTIYLFALAIKNKDSRIATLFYLSLAGLGFSHHLSTFIFLYVFLGFLFIFFIFALLAYRFDLKAILKNITPYFAIFLSKSNLATLFIILCFIFFVHTPSYLNKDAIDTAVGSPSKSTRVGLLFGELLLSVGAWKLFYAILGAMILFIITIKKLINKPGKIKIAQIMAISLMLSWFSTIFLMSTKPELLKVDIISSRIVSYITIPLAIFSAFFIAFAFQKLFKRTSLLVAQTLFFIVIGTGVISGFADISDSVRKNNPAEEKEVMQTYKASEYLNLVAKKEENVLKDHIYLKGDTWMKLFFMKEYTYPLSRSYLRRYDDPTKTRETCTRDMIAIPHSEIGQQCFSETGVRYVVLKKGFETAQFEKSKNFSKIYASSDLVIYQRNNVQ